MSGTPFENANLVVLPYCSGDAWMGDTTKQLTLDNGTTITVPHRGRRIARAAVKELIGDKENQEILFGGSSAGSRGSMVLIDMLHEVVPSSTTIRGVLDSGVYQDLEPKYPGIMALHEESRRAFQRYTPPVSQSCASAYSGDEQWKCIFGAYALPLLETPSQVPFYLYDSYQIMVNFGYKNPNQWDQENIQWVDTPFRHSMQESAKQIAKKHVVFAAACFEHVMMDDYKWQNVTVNGISAQDHLIQWYFHDSTHSVFDTCKGFNCCGGEQQPDDGGEKQGEDGGEQQGEDGGEQQGEDVSLGVMRVQRSPVASYMSVALGLLLTLHRFV